MFPFGGFGGGGGGGGFGGGVAMYDEGPFEETYKIYSVAFFDKASLEKGDKVVLPASALVRLTKLRVQYPMLFSISKAKATNRKSHVGVIEFTAEEGRCYVPHWVMQNLDIPEGGIATLSSVRLKKATFVKFQPHTKNFIELSNPKAV